MNFHLNYIDITILAIFVLFTIVGYSKGLLVSVLNLLRSICGVILCFAASSYLSPIIYNNFVKNTVQSYVSNQVDQVAAGELATNIKDTINSLPSIFQGAIDTSAVNDFSSANSVDYIMSNIVDPVANVVIKVTVFIVVFILFSIVAGLIISLIEKKNKKDKSLLGKTNRLLGGVLGFVKAVIIVLAFVSVLNFFIPYTNGGKNHICTVAQNSVIFDFINKINPINMLVK